VQYLKEVYAVNPIRVRKGVGSLASSFYRCKSKVFFDLNNRF
jgi:hypothetical protein